MNNKYTRTVFTGLTGLTNKTILDSVMGQLSDGMWENSPAMRKYWLHARITIGSTGEVAILVDESYGSGFRSKSDADIMLKFAYWIKVLVKTEIEDGVRGDWNRSDKSSLRYLNHGDVKVVTIADAYAAYDGLRGRNVNRLQNNAAKKAQKASAIALVDDEIRRIENQLATMKAKRAAL